MGGDERAAVHALIAALSDRPHALALLETLLVSVGRADAAALVYAHRRAANGFGWANDHGPVKR